MNIKGAVQTSAFRTFWLHVFTRGSDLGKYHGALPSYLDKEIVKIPATMCFRDIVLRVYWLHKFVDVIDVAIATTRVDIFSCALSPDLFKLLRGFYAPRESTDFAVVEFTKNRRLECDSFKKAVNKVVAECRCPTNTTMCDRFLAITAQVEAALADFTSKVLKEKMVSVERGCVATTEMRAQPVIVSLVESVHVEALTLDGLAAPADFFTSESSIALKFGKATFELEDRFAQYAILSGNLSAGTPETPAAITDNSKTSAIIACVEFLMSCAGRNDEENKTDLSDLWADTFTDAQRAAIPQGMRALLHSYFQGVAIDDAKDVEAMPLLLLDASADDVPIVLTPAPPLDASAVADVV